MPADAYEGYDDRRRANEDEHFRKRDHELVEQVRARVRDQAALDRLAEAAGVADEDILRNLHKLGYTAESVALLQLVPLIDVAWADGHVSERERRAIIAVTRALGIESGSHPDRQLAQWLVQPPTRAFLDGTLRLLRALIQRHPPDEQAAAVRRVRSACSAVASAAGGLIGFHPISAKERRALDRILSELDGKEASLTES